MWWLALAMVSLLLVPSSSAAVAEKPSVEPAIAKAASGTSLCASLNAVLVDAREDVQRFRGYVRTLENSGRKVPERLRDDLRRAKRRRDKTLAAMRVENC